MRTPRGWILFLAIVAGLLLILAAGSSRSNAWKVREARFAHQVAGCVAQAQARLPAIEPDAFSVAKGLVRYRIGEFSNFQGSTDEPEHLDFASYIKVIAEAMLQGTAYAGRFTLNEIPEPTSINIYFLDCDMSATVRGFPSSNCTYVGYVNSIVCRTKAIDDQFAEIDRITRAYDVALLDARTHVRLGAASPAVLDVTRHMLKQSLITWMIGHELGHAVNHKDVVSGSQKPLHFNFLYTQIERQADEFIAAKLAANEALLAASQAGLGISEFIHQQYRILLKEQFPDFDETLLAVRDLPTVVPLEITVAAGNYPLILRAVNVKRAITDARIYADDTGYPTIVGNNVISHSAEPATYLTPVISTAAVLLLLGALAGSMVPGLRNGND